MARVVEEENISTRTLHTSPYELNLHIIHNNMAPRSHNTAHNPPALPPALSVQLPISLTYLQHINQPVILLRQITEHGLKGHHHKLTRLQRCLMLLPNLHHLLLGLTSNDMATAYLLKPVPTPEQITRMHHQNCPTDNHLFLLCRMLSLRLMDPHILRLPLRLHHFRLLKMLTPRTPQQGLCNHSPSEVQ